MLFLFVGNFITKKKKKNRRKEKGNPIFNGENVKMWVASAK